MKPEEVAERFRRELIIAQAVSGGSLIAKVRNLAWLLELIDSSSETWTETELDIVAEEIAPFLPTGQRIEAMTSLPVLELLDEGDRYGLRLDIDLGGDLGRSGLRTSMYALPTSELRELLRSGAEERHRWTRADLRDVLLAVRRFGYHCIRGWQALAADGRQSDGVPFLWNVAADGRTSPMGTLAASSATIDIVRLAVEPDLFLELTPTVEEAELVRWAIDQLFRNVTTSDGRSACFVLADDDSYPNAAHPINDTQGRLIQLLLTVSADGMEHLDDARRTEARTTTLQLADHLVGQQLRSDGDPHGGFWTFHRFDDVKLDAFQVLSINSEFAGRALVSVAPAADDDLRRRVESCLARLATALRRTAIRSDEGTGWHTNLSTLSGADLAGPVDVLVSARAAYVLALVGADDATDMVLDALRLVEATWATNALANTDDLEFIPYRTPEQDAWSDGTFRITNPVSAVLPYYVMRSCRLIGAPIPLVLAEGINNCMNLALGTYSGHGFWEDPPTGLAYPTNTAFYMDMIIEYLRSG